MNTRVQKRKLSFPYFLSTITNGEWKISCGLLIVGFSTQFGFLLSIQFVKSEKLK